MGDFVKKRFAYMEKTPDGSIRSTGWATAITTVGACHEPFIPFTEIDLCVDSVSGTFDPVDDMNLVTELYFVDSVQLPSILSGGQGDPPLIGGNVGYPRAGKR